MSIHIAYVISKTILRNLNYFQCLNMEKAWFMAPTEYSPNGKGIMVPKKYILYSSNGKAMVLRKIVFKSGNRHGERF